MRFGHIELFVADPLKSRDFYTKVLGFDLIKIEGGGKFVWLRLDEVELLLRRGTPPTPTKTYQEAGAGIVLYTRNLDARAARLRDKGLEFKGIDGSDRCLTFTDLDGNWFQLANPHE